MSSFGPNHHAASAWVDFNGTGSLSTRDSFNVSGVADIAGGNYRVNFSTSLSNNNYCFTGTSSGDDGNYGYTFIKGTVNNQFVYSTSNLRLGTGYASATNSTAQPVDAHQINVVIHGDI